MAQLHLLESDSPQHGGALIVYPSGYRQQIAWRCSPDEAARADPWEVGKQLATQAAEGLEARGAVGLDDLERTNWASMAAGLGSLFRGWGERGRARSSEGVYPGAGASPPAATNQKM